MPEKLKSIVAARLLAGLFILVVSVSTAFAQAAIPQLGSGACEVILFSDYLCPPCKTIDAKAEPLLKELLASGKVKITFADVPFHRATPLYARYFLYAVNAGAGDDEIFRIRRELFKAGQESGIDDADALTNYLREKKIAWKAFDAKPVFLLLNDMIKIHKIDETPTCIIRCPGAPERKYSGTEEIWQGLTQLKMDQSPGKKPKDVKQVK